MTLVDLLSLLVGVVGCSCIVGTARNAGKIDIIISWIVGLLIGFGSLWATRLVMKWIILRLRLQESNASRLRLLLSWILCLATIIWIIIFGFLAVWATRLILSNVK